MENSNSYSLDDLRASKEEIRESYISIISIIIYDINFLTDKPNFLNIAENLKKYMSENYPYRGKSYSSLKEGFLKMNLEENIFRCIYAKESPIKIEFAFNESEIFQDKIKLITPDNSVKIKLNFSSKGIRIILFSGNMDIIKKVLTILTYSLKYIMKEEWYKSEVILNYDEMKRILPYFINVEYLWIGPGDSEKFIKIIEKKIGKEIKKIPEYQVYNKLSGIRITKSPYVMEVINEEKINILEIQGRILILGTGITIRINSDGKILFWIPSTLIPKNKTIYDISEFYYNQILEKNLNLSKKILQSSLNNFFNSNHARQ